LAWLGFLYYVDRYVELTLLKKAFGLCHLGECLVQVSKVEFTQRLEILVDVNGCVQLITIEKYTNEKCALNRAVEFLVSFEGVFDNLFKKASAV
jgi:hypothetical protein